MVEHTAVEYIVAASGYTTATLEKTAMEVQTTVSVSVVENEIALSHIDEQFENHIHVVKEIVSRPSKKSANTINKGSLIVEDGKHRGEVHLLKTVWNENLTQKLTSKDDPTEVGSSV